jgi:hypothetical protein
MATEPAARAIRIALRGKLGGQIALAGVGSKQKREGLQSRRWRAAEEEGGAWRFPILRYFAGAM